MKTSSLSKFAGVFSVVALGAWFLIPGETEENFPVIEGLLTFTFLLFAVSSVVSIVATVKEWKKLSVIWRVAPFLAPFVWLTFFCMVRFGTPEVDIETTYNGAQPGVQVDIEFGHGAIFNNVVKRGEPWTTNLGRATPYLTVGWGVTFEEKRAQRKEFLVGDRIPCFGRDRIIKITLLDGDARIQIDQR
jgi:hypothetical protein